MALRNFDNFDSGAALAASYPYILDAVLSAGNGIGGSTSLRTTAAKTDDLNNGVYQGVASQHRTGTMGIWSNFTVAGASDSACIEIWQGDAFLQVRPVGNDLQVWTINGGVIFTAAGVLTPSTFKRVDVQWTVSSLDETNNLNYDGSVELKVDLVAVGSASGIQLGFALPEGYTRDVFWNVEVFNPHGDGDKYYITDGSGTRNTGYMPDNVVIYNALPATGNGTYTELTPSSGTDHGAMVDESTADDDTTYNSTTGASRKDSYWFTDFSSVGSQFVYGLKHTATGKKLAPGYRRFRSFTLRSDNIQFASTDHPIGIGFFDWMQNIYETDPYTGQRWVISNINATEFGVLLA